MKLNRVERLAAKRWVKERLVRMFPELRNDPQALEELYRGLSLEPRPGIGKGGAPVFVVVLPEKFEL
ncbi:MAG: hypothetical protein N2035_09725 [Chthoniobacterales bacterium]|nr:hypothetical protein [Chthoniobacterales bacterium]